MDVLPHIDEHSTEIDAAPGHVWAALLRVVGRTSGGRAGEAVAGALGCEPQRRSGKLPEPDSTIVGFRVERADAPAGLALEGRHRFSRYALILRIDELGGGRSRLRAETRAEFPGAAGRVYRTLVIGTRGHVLAVRRILGVVKRDAER